LYVLALVAPLPAVLAAASPAEILNGSLMLLAAAFIGLLMLGTPRWPSED
jgi:hypothetical protein